MTSHEYHSLISQFRGVVGDTKAKLFLECDIRWATLLHWPGFSLNYDSYKPRRSDGRTNIRCACVDRAVSSQDAAKS